jgi:hypothetical protein
MGRLDLQLPSACTSELVVPGSPVVFREAPVRLDPPFLSEFVEGRIQGSLVHLQVLIGDHPNPLADAPSVERFNGEDLEDQHVQSASNHVRMLFSHGCHLESSTGFAQGISFASDPLLQKSDI